MKKYSSKYLPLIITAACAVGIVLGYILNFSSQRDAPPLNPSKYKLNQLIDYIDYQYIDEVNTDSIVDVTINNILSDLDPHSTYIPKEEFQEASENLEGDFIGIGIQFFRVHDTIAVIRTVEDGPSEKAGIQPGDRILYANDQPLFGEQLTQDSIRQLLSGTIDDKLHLKVKRQGENKQRDIEIAKEHIPIKSVDASYMLSDHLGYVKINRFSGHTYEEFKKALRKLEKEKAHQIVLDLRDNGGGYLKEAIKIADEFLNDSTLILKTKDKSGKVKETYATDHGDFINTKVYVLLNQNSASASEIVAGALQDNDIGTIVGQRSFGKGLVQREMELGDGSAVRLTIAQYYTPTGRSIQRPYKGKSNQKYFRDYLTRYNNGELRYKDSIHVNDSLKYTTPKGKTVYGGGGIIPDLFVPKDTNYKRESLTYMLRSGVMDRFVFEQMDKDRAYYNQFSLEDFEQEFTVDDQMVNDFINFLDHFGLQFKNEDAYTATLKNYLKTAMAGQLFGSDIFENRLSKHDPVIQKVLEDLD